MVICVAVYFKSDKKSADTGLLNKYVLSLQDIS